MGLVLGRHEDESIYIGDDIRVMVVQIRGDKVRLLIDAPKELPVHRSEVYDAIKRGETKPKRNAGQASCRQCGKQVSGDDKPCGFVGCPFGEKEKPSEQ